MFQGSKNDTQIEVLLEQVESGGVCLRFPYIGPSGPFLWELVSLGGIVALCGWNLVSGTILDLMGELLGS